MNSIINIIVTILEFVLALGFLAFLHELGHFLVARLFKIEIKEFGFGFPPRAVRLFTLGGTDFTLNWIPFGAFVLPKGENDPNIPGGMAAAKPGARLAVLFGGPVMNLLVGILIFSFVFARAGGRDTSVVLIREVTKDTPAAQAGILPGDIVESVNGNPIDSVENLRSIITANQGNEVTIALNRSGRTIVIKTTPRKNPPAGQGSLGVGLDNPIIPMSWFQAVPYAAKITGEQALQLLLLPGQLIKGTITPDQARVVGPVGMYDIFSQARSLDAQSVATPNSQTPPVTVLSLLGTISIALGLTNLLPFPALDGGRIIFVLPELIFKRRVPPEFENMVHLIGFAALIILLVVITTQDIIHPIVIP
jgi:regulator of sigma E protease